MRTPSEILERIKELDAAGDDVFGFGRAVLVAALPFEHAKTFLQPDTTPAQWDADLKNTDADVKATALAYLEFAWGKAEDHRGLSADRSVQKMLQYCWLLGLDVAKIESAGYTNYGAPKLKAAAELLGASIPTSSALLAMMRGAPCRPGCEEGCGS